MNQEELIEYLETEGYMAIREIPGRGLVGLQRFAFTIGLVYGLGPIMYEGRYCYSHAIDAYRALETWDGVGDPPDANWIKHKGHTEYSNPKKNEDELSDNH